jgi:hypothetical protein
MKRDKCIKCGSNDISVTYQQKGAYETKPNTITNFEELKEDRLMKYCRNCQFEWVTKTLDQS